jgi:hypothetical protein
MLHFWAVMPRKLVSRYQRFGETYCFQLWRRTQYLPPKRCHLPTSLHGVRTLRNNIFIVVRTSNYHHSPVSTATSNAVKTAYVTRISKHHTSPALKTETVCFSETLAFTYESTRHQNPAEHLYRRENLTTFLFLQLRVTLWKLLALEESVNFLISYSKPCDITACCPWRIYLSYIHERANRQYRVSQANVTPFFKTLTTGRQNLYKTC